MFLEKKDVKSEYIACRVTPEMKRNLKKLAKKEGVTLSSAIIQLAKMGLHKYQVNKEGGV